MGDSFVPRVSLVRGSTNPQDSGFDLPESRRLGGKPAGSQRARRVEGRKAESNPSLASSQDCFGSRTRNL